MDYCLSFRFSNVVFQIFLPKKNVLFVEGVDP